MMLEEKVNFLIVLRRKTKLPQGTTKPTTAEKVSKVVKSSASAQAKAAQYQVIGRKRK